MLSDFRETVSDLLLETFTNEWANWAHSKGKTIRNQAHGSPANILDLYAASDIPETEGTDLIRIKFATSAAHVAGRRLASSESATWLDEHFRSNLADLKENLDRYLVGGVNHLLYHGSCYSPLGDEWPGRLFYAAIHVNPRNTLWNDFADLNQYVARIQSFMQAGKPDNDILLYFPAYDRFATPQRELLDHFDGHGPSLEGTHFEEIALFLLEKGFAYDYISDRQIQQLSVANGFLETGGISYKTILVPETEYIPLETMKSLLAWAEQGAKVIFHQELPRSVPGLIDLDEKQQIFQNMLDSLSFQVMTDGVAAAQKGEGSVLLGADPMPLLEFVSVKRESMVDHGLGYARRTYQDGNSYFLANWSGKEVNDWIPLQTEAKSVMIFDPMSGRKGKARVRNSQEGTLEVFLQLAHGESLVLLPLLQNRRLQIGNIWRRLEMQSHWMEHGRSSLSLEDPFLPAAVTTNSLSSWTDWENDTYRNFSGTARYSLTFSKPDESGSGWLLDLGKVHESARLKLNGQELGTLVGPVYRIFIPSEQIKESNTLEIDVSNLMANRIADMDRRNVLWKKFTILTSLLANVKILVKLAC